MTHEYDVVVIGGGQAGLATGYHLAAQGRRFVILEAADAPAAAWRSRWDSLRLFTPARHDGLPGMPFPGDPDRYPTRDEVVAYLTEYARRFALPVELGSRVSAVRARPGGFAVELADRTRVARQVVVATGPFQTPRVPAIAGGLGAEVHQLHSSAYRAPAEIPPGPVLVVGGGNTGFQIADELAATHEVHLAVGARQTPLPQRLLGRDVFGCLTALGLMDRTVDSRIGRRLRDRETLIGSSPRAIRRRGVRVHGRAVGASGSTVTFADGTAVDPRTVVWATGFGLDHSFVRVPVFDAAGAVVHRRGVTAAPGLYFLGLPWQHTRGSALLGWVGRDAAFLAGRIAAHAAMVGPMDAEPDLVRQSVTP
jgi:putative flavoprotein involved in K+ transport